MIADIQLWMTFAIIAGAVISFATERISLEITAVFTIAALLLLFYILPVPGVDGSNMLSPARLLAGFANPALVTIMALLIIGQALYQTGALEAPARLLSDMGTGAPRLVLTGTLIAAGLMSAFLNNTPVVVIFLPIVSALASRLGAAKSGVLMPLSFLCILGGMTTLIGSSSNLLVSGVAVEQGAQPIGFFDFIVPGAFLALVGGVYSIFVMPRLLRPRESMAGRVAFHGGKHFIAEIIIGKGHPLDGERSIAGLFPGLKNMTVRMVQRGERSILPPFEDVELSPGDLVIVAATRETLTQALKSGENLLLTEQEEGGLTLAEVMIAPGSIHIGRRLAETGLRAATGYMVLGVERRARIFRITMNDIRLKAGDVLLLLGQKATMKSLSANRDLLLLDGSLHNLPRLQHAMRAQIIFLLTVAVAALGIVPIVIAALIGAAGVIASGCLSLQKAARSFDKTVYMLIGAALAMAAALEVTGGALWIASSIIDLLKGQSPYLMTSVFFLVIALMTNVLSNHATAALFTPIALVSARQLDMDPAFFLHTVIFAANCSFATPMAYQTNLLVMGPGHYRFSDYLRAGGPLVILIWLTWTLFAPYYYGLG